jgi:tRNA(Ile)-lysidine synthetase-like protein
MDFQYIILAFVIIFLLVCAYFIYITIPYQDLIERPKNYGFGDEQIYEIDMNLSLVKKIEVFCLNNNVFKNGVIVSLSGGVDSMVVLAILIKLSLKYKFPVYACSINYNLRTEQKNEMHFLKIYCSIYDVKCYFKEVKGYSRKQENSGPRSEFEEESRKIRYDLYQEIINEHKCSGVFVGHHKDDIIENIFTNSMKGANLLDLEVMKEISTIRGINIYRPLLNCHKDVIYDLAHTYSIPYFLDTTPKWSRRGRMRNEIFVLFDNVFTKSWRNKLKDLGDQSNKWGEYINNYVIKLLYLLLNIFLQ